MSSGSGMCWHAAANTVLLYTFRVPYAAMPRGQGTLCCIGVLVRVLVSVRVISSCVLVGVLAGGCMLTGAAFSTKVGRNTHPWEV